MTARRTETLADGVVLHLGDNVACRRVSDELARPRLDLPPPPAPDPAKTLFEETA